jgi:uracil phosphoribosyltransferase
LRGHLGRSQGFVQFFKLENYEDYSIKTVFDKKTMTYRYEKQHLIGIAQMLQRSGQSMIDNGTDPFKTINNGVVKSYAEAVRRNVPADYHKKLREMHLSKLEKDPEYALQFVKSGRQPAPTRQRKPLTIIYFVGK